jgi:hypothetical protein
MMKIAGSRSGSGSICQRQGSADPDLDPYQNVMDPQQSDLWPRLSLAGPVPGAGASFPDSSPAPVQLFQPGAPHSVVGSQPVIQQLTREAHFCLPTKEKHVLQGENIQYLYSKKNSIPNLEKDPSTLFHATVPLNMACRVSRMFVS